MKNKNWNTAIGATLHCLTGCSIGEILGMSIGMFFNWEYSQKIMLAIPLAFLFGYSLTIYSLHKSGINFKKAVTLAFASDTLSILTMEVVDNIVILFIPRSMSAGFSVRYWISLLISLTIAFFLTVPVNRLLISKGLGHAKIHSQMHHTHNTMEIDSNNMEQMHHNMKM